MFVRAANPIWYMVDTNGIPLNSGDYIFFLTNDLPYVPQPVYETPNGTPWSNPIEFQPGGTLPNNLYFDPSLTYRIEVRGGPTQVDPLIWLIENFTPEGEGGGGGGNSDTVFTAQNIITNPQFADLFVPTSYTFTQSTPDTYTINIGPGWKLVLTGSGSTVLTQLAIPGDPAPSPVLTGNPPYALQIQNSGWSTAKLIQTFDNNGALFSGGALVLSFASECQSSSQVITAQYNPSIGTSQTLFSGTIATGGFQNYYGAIQTILASSNTDSGFSANVQLVFNISGNGTIAFTDIQLLGQSSPLSDSFVLPNQTNRGSVPLFQEEPYAVILNNEFHTYAHSLIMEPKDSILTGWNFGLNPWQAVPSTATTIPNNSYTADQTIIIQQNYVANTVGSNVSVSRSSASSNFGFQVTAITATNIFAILQFIDPSTIAQYWNYVVSSLVKSSLVTSHGTSVRFKMRLISSTTIPGTASLSRTYPITSWVAGSDPVFDSSFNVIIPNGDPIYTFSGLNQTFPFNNIQLPSASTSTMTLGIIIYTLDPMNQNSTADSIVFNDVSLVPNTFAIQSNPLTFDETLRRCQFYYEKTYDPFVYSNTVTNTGARWFTCPIAPDNTNLYKSSFMITFNTQKRVAPLIRFFSPTGTSDMINVGIWDGDLTHSNPGYPNPFGSSPFISNPLDRSSAAWTYFFPSTSVGVVKPNNTTKVMQLAGPAVSGQGEMVFHYIADCRIGVI